MKTVVSLFLLSIALHGSLSAQFLDPQMRPKPGPDMPEWAKYLYEPNVNAVRVDSAYRAYYAVHPLVRNNWTRYYRRWQRMMLPFIQGDGSVREYTGAELEKFYARDPIKGGATKSNAADTWKQFRMETYFSGGGAICPWQSNIYALDVAPSNPNILYCTPEPGGLYKSTDKGVSWVQIGKEYAWHSEAVAIAPNNPNVVLVGINGSIRKTTDGGQTWSTTVVTTSFYCHDIKINPANTNICLAATNKGSYRSTDGGASWTRVMVDPSSDIEFQPGNPNQVYILSQPIPFSVLQCMKSTDAGATFSPRTVGWVSNVGDGLGRLAVTPADPNRIYAIMLTDSGPRLLRSVNAGENWTLTAVGESSKLEMTNGQGYYDLSIVASPNNADHLIVGTTTAYKSTDGGVNFSVLGGYYGPFSIHPDIQDMKAVGNDTWIATDGGLTYSTDFFSNTANAQTRMNGLNASDFWGFDQGWNEDVFVGGRYHNGNTAYHESYGGRFLRLGGAESATGYINPVENKRTYFSDLGSQILPDSFQNDPVWEPVRMYPNESYYTMEFSEMAWDPRCYSTVYIGNGNKFWKSVNGAFNYEPIFTSSDNGAVIEHIEISRSNPDIIYISQRSNSLYDGKIWKTTNGGTTWSALPNFPNTTGSERRVMAMTLSGTDEKELWVALRNGQPGRTVFKTTDGGATWINYSTPTINGVKPSDILHQMGTDGGVYLAGDGGKVYYRNNTLNDWQPMYGGLPADLVIVAMKPFYRDGRLRCGTSSGVWDAQLYEPSKPVAQPSADKLVSYCSRDTFYFGDYSVLNRAGATWNWSFPGATYVSSTTDPNPRVLYPSTGKYTVSLTVTDGTGATNSKTVTDMIEVKASECSIDSVAGSVLNLTGADNYIHIPPVTGLKGATGLTVTAWIKLNGMQEWFTQIISNWSSNCGFGFGFAFLGYKYNTNLTFSWKGVAYQLTTPFNLDSNKWIHVAMTVEPDKVTLYRDGVPWVYKGVFTNFDLASTPFDVGQGVPGQGGDFEGQIEELKIYNRALSQDEIRQNMHLIHPQGEQGLAGYYQFNESPLYYFFNRVGSAHARNGSATRTLSTAPVAKGTSYRIEVKAGGLKDFTGTGLRLFFQQPSVYPNGEIVASHLLASPDTLPNSTERFTNSYWVLHNYGTPGAFNLDSAVFSRLGDKALTNADASNPNRLKLYRREEANAFEQTWTPIANATSADSVISTITFAGNNGIGEGQYIIGTTGSSTLGMDDEDDEDEAEGLAAVEIYPQPVRDICTVRYRGGSGARKDVTILLINSLGQVLRRWTFDHTGPYRLDLSDVPFGVYAVKVNDEVGLVVRGKW